MKCLFGGVILLTTVITSHALDVIPAAETGHYWNARTKLLPFRLPTAPEGYKSAYLDFDREGGPDRLETTTTAGIPVMWMDDEHCRRYGDLEEDTRRRLSVDRSE